MKIFWLSTRYSQENSPENERLGTNLSKNEVDPLEDPPSLVPLLLSMDPSDEDEVRGGSTGKVDFIRFSMHDGWGASPGRDRIRAVRGLPIG